MSDPSHPYTNLPKHAFWKTAVAELDTRQIDLAWKPKAPVSRATGIITVGSCFAQHISKSLKENGFSWLDSEPAPTELPPAEHARHGYGVFSFRTGNIYTAALLRQWVMWTIGKAGQSTESFLDDGRFFDPFRPSLTVEGFSSAGEMLAARRTTLAAMLEAIQQADLFVFTLGLTEAWLNKDGSVYPMCPGTIRGTFSAEEHVFHNYDGSEVVRDLTETFDELRRINRNLRFLLTVSPVPLTATASGQHVLTATTYSKSVLRSAAGYLAQIREDTDYFPSYELITAPAFKGQFFEPNMRSVSAAGVAFVMRQFFGATGAVVTQAAPELFSGTKAVTLGGFEKTESETDICDDIILETWSNRPIDDSEEPPNILLIGDSQMGMIAKVLDEQGIRYAGGAIMQSSQWHNMGFAVVDELFFEPYAADAKARWDEAYRISLARYEPATRQSRWIITNIGMHSIMLNSKVYGIEVYLKERLGSLPELIDPNDFIAYLNIARINHVNLVRKFVAAGYGVVWVTDPPYQPIRPEVFAAIDLVLSHRFRNIGCRVFNAREWIERLGGFPAEFRSTEIDQTTGEADWLHGSPEYYRQLAKEIFREFQIQPQYRQSA